MRLKKIIFLLTTLISLIMVPATYAAGTYQTSSDFLNSTFSRKVPKPTMLWITKELKPEIRKIMGHDLSVLRLRYWKQEDRTAWILNEIGKEKPITAGLVINKGKIESLSILIFRENRGDEVRHPFFTNQFKGLSLNIKDEFSAPIDGITGATLSVRAVKKMSRLALFLDRHIRGNNAS